ncbi:MAG: hypothetical protein MJ025_01845, partial [Victivallaceae bacterium]|nr:hypothetical protein [Victivallaceae bacterium]
QVMVLQHSAAPGATPVAPPPLEHEAEPCPTPVAQVPEVETEATLEPVSQQPVESRTESTGEFHRKSVISSHPELIENSLNDKFVADVANTFEAKPIDVHVPVE